METRSTYVDHLNKRLNDAYKPLSEELILKMAKTQPTVNNVVNGLNKECFGLWTYEDGFSPNYTLTYINGQTKLQGESINLNLEDKDKFDITMAFCHHLASEYKHLDQINVFNTFSHSLRSYIEMFGYMTVTDIEMEDLEGYNFTMITKAKGIFYVPLIDKLKFYRNFFDNNYNQPKPTDENVIYLLLDLKHGNIKVGRSAKITQREKTLQAEAPKIETIAFWKAPKEVERHLHKTFAAKRLRGEWFQLTFSDMHEIKKYMSQYDTTTV